MDVCLHFRQCTLLVSLVAVLGTPLQVVADEVPVSVVHVGEVDANDATHTCVHLQDSQRVERPGVYPYAYGPTVLWDEQAKLFRVWCSVGWNGDTIGYKQADSLDKLYAEPWEIVLDPRRATASAAFDATHCCDPAIIHAEDGYYLYYSGANDIEGYRTLPGGIANGGVGVARATDPRGPYTRLCDKRPIVMPDRPGEQGYYGTGQPAVTRGHDGAYYMILTWVLGGDKADLARNALVVLRSQTPDFANYTEVSRLSTDAFCVTVDFAWHPRLREYWVIANYSLPGFGCTIAIRRLESDLKTLKGEWLLRKTDDLQWSFGEGLGMVCNMEHQVIDGVPGQWADGCLGFLGATYRNRDANPDPLAHINGPVCYAVLTPTQPLLDLTGELVVQPSEPSTIKRSSSAIQEGAVPLVPGAVVGRITITIGTQTVGMGRNATIKAQASDLNGEPVSDVMLYPFVNQKRWGAQELTDANGQAVFLLPLPRPGEAKIQVAALTGEAEPQEEWIWSESLESGQPRYFQKVFNLNAKPLSGEVWLAAVDVADVYVNGRHLAQKIFWTGCQPTSIPVDLLHTGENIISVEGRAGAGWAGLLVYARFETEAGSVIVGTSPDWQVWQTPPEGWPEKSAQGGQVPISKGRADKSSWLPAPWPTLVRDGLRFTGSAPMGELLWSNAEIVQVTERELVIPARREGQHIVAQYESWFTPFNAWWQTTQAIPLVGFYDSRNPDVARQHLIWLMESGVDVVSGDWSNHIWFSKRWEDISPGSWEIITATQVFLEEMARMKDEGYPVPSFTLLSGISHVRPEGPDAVNGQLKWIWDNLVENPRLGPLWEKMDGKPLITLLNLGATYIKEGLDSRLDQRFIIRYVSAGNDSGDDETLGLWTWMDHKYPVPTVVDGRTEAVTVSVGCFGSAGWKDASARGRRNGATLVEDWRIAMEARPQYLFLHQFQEFLGATEGHGLGENKDVYYDTYSVELSDDIEPVSLTAPAYRGEGGWGYYYLNLTRALVDLYRQEQPETTVLVISNPVRKQIIESNELDVSWVWVGNQPAGFDLYANGRLLGENLQGDSAIINLSEIPDGPVQLRLVARDTLTRYKLSYEHDESPLTQPEHAECVVHIVKQVVNQSIK